jgi:hypothetical protein
MPALIPMLVLFVPPAPPTHQHRLGLVRLMCRRYVPLLIVKLQSLLGTSEEFVKVKHQWRL